MLQLKLNGKLFGGWTEAIITKGITQLASTFELKVTDRWGNTKWSIAPFDACEILWKGQCILTGYVDGNAISYDSNSHVITISGRSKTGDLVDCAAASAQFKQQSFEQIAAALCAPFNIKVDTQVSTGNDFLTWKPDDGVQVFESLEKLARLRGLLLMDNSVGNLVVTQAGKNRISTALELGINIKAGSGRFSVKDRYSDYLVKGQQKGSDDISPEFAAHVSALVKDESVNRYRPTLLHAEDQADILTAQNRAQWEKNIRFGLSQSFSYTVQGWEHSTGLWQPNTLVRVKDSIVGLNTDLIIAGVRYSIGNEGTTTNLELAHPKAFSPEPLVINQTQPVKKGTASSGGIRWQELDG